MLRLWQFIRLTVPLLTLALCGCSTAPDLSTSRQFQLAEQEFAQATTADDFVKAAALYQSILDNGFTSGSVLYNQGNAWMQAGETGRAIASYRQAKRHLPRDPYLDANLKQALPPTADARKTPLLDYIFFWQHSISYHEKALLATLLLAFALITGLVANSGWHSTLLRRISLVSIAATLLVGLSWCRDWIDIETTTHGVVVASEVIARKGDSESYEPAFNQPLSAGTEFVVIAERNDWLNVSVGDAGEGWLRARDVVTY